MLFLSLCGCCSVECRYEISPLSIPPSPSLSSFLSEQSGDCNRRLLIQSFLTETRSPPPQRAREEEEEGRCDILSVRAISFDAANSYHNEKHPLLRKIEIETLKTLLLESSVIYLSVNQTLYRYGSQDNFIYVILFGKLLL